MGFGGAISCESSPGGLVLGISGTLVAWEHLLSACQVCLKIIWLGVVNAPLVGVEREGPDPDAEVQDDVAVPQFPHLSVGKAIKHPARAETFPDELDRSADTVEGLVLVLDLDRVQYTKKPLIASRNKGFSFLLASQARDVGHLPLLVADCGLARVRGQNVGAALERVPDHTGDDECDTLLRFRQVLDLAEGALADLDAVHVADEGFNCSDPCGLRFRLDSQDSGSAGFVVRDLDLDHVRREIDEHFDSPR